MEGITCVSNNDKFWNVQFLKKHFDKKSRTIIKDFTKKSNKSNWVVSRCYAKETYPTIERLQTEVLKTLSSGGIVIRTRGEHGSYDLGTVTQNNDSSFKFSLMDTIDRKTYREKSEVPAEVVEKLVTKNVEVPTSKPVVNIIFDPNSEEAKALIGRTVEISTSFSFSTSRVIVLESIEASQPMPFWGRTTEDGKQVSGVFIRPYTKRTLPLDLNDESVRALLRGRWIINKVNGQETMITNFRKENGQYRCNGLDAHTLLMSWTFDDGKPVGIEK